jgi:hypothetical protein
VKFVAVISRLWKCANGEALQGIAKTMATCHPELVKTRRHIFIQYVYLLTKDETKWEDVHSLGTSIPPLTVKQVLINFVKI